MGNAESLYASNNLNNAIGVMMNVSDFDLIANKFTELAGVLCEDQRYVLWNDEHDKIRKKVGKKALSVLCKLRREGLIRVHESTWHPHCYRVTVLRRADFLAYDNSVAQRVDVCAKYSWFDRGVALDECRRLIMEGKTDSELIDIVITSLFDGQCGLQDKAYWIFEKMIETDFCLTEVKDVAHRAVMAFNSNTGIKGVLLFSCLNKKGLFKREALKCALEALGHRSATVRTSGSYLLKKLAKQGLFHKKIFIEVLRLMGANRLDELVNMTEIASGLLKGGYDPSAFIKVAERAAGNKLTSVQQYGLEFFEKLVKEGVGVEVAKKYVLKHLAADDDRIRDSALKIVQGGLCLNMKFASTVKLLSELRKLLSDVNDRYHIKSAFQTVLEYLPEHLQNKADVKDLAAKWSLDRKCKKLRCDGVKLYCAMISHPEYFESLADFQNLALKWAFDETSAEYRSYGRAMYVRLLSVMDCRANAVRAERLRIKNKDPEDSLLETLVRSGSAFDMALDLLSSDLKGEEPFAHLSLLMKLMPHGEGLELGLQMLERACKRYESYGKYCFRPDLRLLEGLVQTEKAAEAIRYIVYFMMSVPAKFDISYFVRNMRDRLFYLAKSDDSIRLIIQNLYSEMSAEDMEVIKGTTFEYYVLSLKG